MKKTYLNPTINVVEVKMEQLLGDASLNPTGGRGTVSDSFVSSGTAGEARGGSWDDED